MNLSGKYVLVIGLGETGLAMAKWLSRQGARVRVADSRMQPPNQSALQTAVPSAELICGPFADNAFDGAELIALSPGVPVQEPHVQQALARGVPVVSEIELFAWGVRQEMSPAQIIAITGSNGKTTTTALTAHMINGAGVDAVACGNISPAALDALMVAQDSGRMPAVWVLELSSFQLETTHTLNADAAVVLNISEDHLDRYVGMDEYAVAKTRVFEGCGVMVVNRDDPRCMAWNDGSRKTLSFGLGAVHGSADYGISGGWIVRGQEHLIELERLKLVGLHNAANAMAALALCSAVGVDGSKVLDSLAGFNGLAHRVEWVATINGVAYYDDSKGTNVGSTLAAVQGMGRKVAVILGGEGKGQDFSPLKSALAAHACGVALIGRDASLIAEAIAGCDVPQRFCNDLAEAVQWCGAQTQTGDAVLLSPACASFDMFRNYGHRAEVFVEIVHAMQREGADAARI